MWLSVEFVELCFHKCYVLILRLPLSSHIKHVSEVPAKSSEDGLTPEEIELRDVREKFQDSQPTGSLLNQCKTIDQAKALLEFIDAITDKKLDRTVSLTAARGRGKSAALGLSIAAAIGKYFLFNHARNICIDITLHLFYRFWLL